MFGASSESAEVSAWSKKPQSMQLTAPSSSFAPHDGQLLGEPPSNLPAVGKAGLEAGSVACAPDGTAGPRTGGGALAWAGRDGAAAAADTGAGGGTADGAGATKPFLHLGQRNCLPAAPS